MMGVLFDGPNRLIIVASGTLSIDMTSVYSRWKDWVRVSDNSKYLKAFSVVGGEPTVQGQYITPYFFLENGWKIDASSQSIYQYHPLDVTGIVLQAQGGSPWYSDPSWPLTIVRNIVPIRTETVTTTGGEPISISDIFSYSVEDGLSFQSALRVLVSVLAGKSVVIDGEPVVMKFRDVNDTTDRVTAEVEGSNRVEVTLDTT
jgi:hypothetical protein